MSSYNCCISQGPPSPESLPSRPLRVVTGAAPVAFWSTASHPSKPEDVAQLRALFEDGKSNADEDENRALFVKRSSSTFDAVKSRLRKHLSHELALLKHRPRSTFSNSDEEIRRRKELRLIRDRSIKEELSSECAYDDDAKSLSTLNANSSRYKVPWPIGGSVGMNSPGILDAASTPSSLKQKFDDEMYVQTVPPVSAIHRRYSLANLESTKPLMATMAEWASRRNSFDSKIPPAPILKPQKLPSIVDSAIRRTSWRLSFTSDQRATRLRALSQEYDDPVSNAESGPRSILPGPFKWFQGHGICTASSGTAIIREFLNVPNDVLSEAVFFSEPDDYEGVDGNIEQLTAPVLLHDMCISQCLASRGLHSHSSSSQLSSWASQSHRLARSNSSEASKTTAIVYSGHYVGVPNSHTSNSKHSTSCEDAVSDGVLSTCASTQNCINHVEEVSRCKVPSLFVSKERQTSLLTRECQAPQTLPIYNTQKVCAAVKMPMEYNSTLFSKLDRRYELGSPLPVSETSSFHEREAGLETIKTRFPTTMETISQSSPMRSKFNEDLDVTQKPNSIVCHEKSSLPTVLQLPRLAKLVSKSYDGASSFELQLPSQKGFGYTFSHRSYSTADAISPGAKSPGIKLSPRPRRDQLQVQEDDAEVIWARALERTKEDYMSQHLNGSAPVKKDEDFQNGNSLASSMSWKLNDTSQATLSSSVGSEIESLRMEIRDFALETQSCRRARKMKLEKAMADEWTDELEARERQARVKTAAIGLVPSPPRAKIPLESWARYSSHTREERTASAGLEDNVKPKDFAIKSMNDGVIGWMTSDRKKHHHHHHEKEQHHSLPIRVSRQIRASLYKLRTKRSTAMSDTIHGRKSSVSVGGNLEFPELEMLAGESPGEGLYQEVERETEEGMRIEERAARKVVFCHGNIDGEVDNEGSMTRVIIDEVLKISIADPKFYDDCIILHLEEGDEVEKTDSNSSNTVTSVEETNPPALANISKKEKYRTWSGRERAPKGFTDNVVLRRSTLDFQMELEKIEHLEKDRAITSAKEAWGGSISREHSG